MTHKNRITYLVLSFILLLPIGSCVDSFTPNLNMSDAKPLLVVEGQITDEVGPFRVKLTNSVPVNVVYSPTPVINADVLIIDDQGNSFRLYGDNNGLYETSDKNLKGIPGNKYTLYITPPGDSVQYTSSPVLMQEVPDIDNVYFEEVKRARFSQGLTYQDNWLNILLDSHDTEGKNKYWRYEFDETWEVNLVSDKVIVHHSSVRPENIDHQFIVPIDDKKKCWVTKPSSSILVANTVKNPVDEIKSFPIQSIGPGDSRLHIRYSILVKQYSISAELYNYWQQLKDFNENNGGMFDKIPSPVYGNITSGTKKALGYFSASSIKERRLFINRSEHQVETVSINNWCYYFDYDEPSSSPKIYFGPDILTGAKVYGTSDFCTDCTFYGTNVKPSFW